MHAHQFWWAWLLRFWRYCYFQKRPIFPFRPWTIVHGHQKIQLIGIGSKNSCKYKLMRHACTPILVGVPSLVSEILLLSKTANFPFPTMDYSPWPSKNLIDRNRLKKLMQVGIDVTCMHTNFWWAWLLWFWRYCYFHKWPIFPFGPWTIVHGDGQVVVDNVSF